MKEWDEIAHERLRQIDSGADASFDKVLSPAILRHVRPRVKVLDIGCGTGTLSQRISRVAGSVTAVDPSRRSIELAQAHHLSPNLEYHAMDASAYLQLKPDTAGTFDLVVANMVLMDTLAARKLMEDAFKLCAHGGHFCATITHPCYWPRYWGYEDAEWFDYRIETQIEAPFRITGQQLNSVTTHIHRPLETYINGLSDAGFTDVRVEELGGSYAPAQSQETSSFRHPKFILFDAGKSAL